MLGAPSYVRVLEASLLSSHPLESLVELPSALHEVPVSEFTRASMRHALATRLGLPRFGLGPHGHASPVTGMWSVEFESRLRPPIAIAVARWGELCRAALVVMPWDTETAIVSRCMAADDVVSAAEKQLRYVPLLGSESAGSKPGVFCSRADPPPSAQGLSYRVESWSQDRCATVSFAAPKRGPLRALATTLHQLVDHVARKTDVLSEIGSLARNDAWFEE